MLKISEWLADHDDVLPALAAVMAGILVWRTYSYGKATGAYRALGDVRDRLASEALGG